MSDLPAMRLMVTNVASGSGAAILTICTGTLPYQTCIGQMSLTATQNAALQVALAAVAGTSTNFDFAAAPAPTVGFANTL